MKVIPNWLRLKILAFKHRLVVKWCVQLGLTPVQIYEQAGTVYIKSQKDGSLHRIGGKAHQAKQPLYVQQVGRAMRGKPKVTIG